MKREILYLIIIYLFLFIGGVYLNNMEGFITGRFNNDIDLDEFDDFKFSMRDYTNVRRVGERCYGHNMCISGECDLTGKYGCKNKCIYTSKDVEGPRPLYEKDPNAHLKNCPALTKYSSGSFGFKVPGIKCRGPDGLNSTIIQNPLKNTSDSPSKKNDFPREVGGLCMSNEDCKTKRCDTTGKYGCMYKCIKKNKDIAGGTLLFEDYPDAALTNCPHSGKTIASSLLVDSNETYKPVIRNFGKFKTNVNCNR